MAERAAAAPACALSPDEVESSIIATGDQLGEKFTMLKTILIALAVIVIVFRRSRRHAAEPEFRVARSTTIAAPPTAVFAQVNDFHKWASMEPLGENRSGSKANLRGCAGWNRHDLQMVR